MSYDEFREGKELVAIENVKNSCDLLVNVSRQENISVEKVREFKNYLKECENKIWEERRRRLQ